MKAWGALAAGVVAALAAGASSEPARPSTRAVAVESASGERAAGFVVAPGRVVTVAHVVEDGGSLRVRAHGGRARRARVLRLDRRADLALLAAPGLAPVGRARIGALDASVGAGSTLRLLLPGRASVRPATVRRAIDIRLRSATGASVRRRSGLELDAAVSRGDSGAPLVTARGEVAGVVFAHSRNRPNIAYAVDASELRRILH